LVNPNPQNVKANFDADVGSDRAYLVVVCRDHIARVTGIWIEPCDCTNPLIEKVRATLLAIIKMKDEGFKSIVF
jgi:hypothetical protein